MLKTRKKWISILLTLAMLVGLMVPLAAPASAASTYSMNYVQKVNAGYSGQIGTLTITMDPVSASTSTNNYVILSLPSSPSGYALFPSVMPSINGTNYFDTTKGASFTLNRISANEVKLTVSGVASSVYVDPNADSRIQIPLDITVPTGVSGDITLTASAPSTSTFSSGTVSVAVVGTGKVNLAVESVPSLSSSGGAIGVIDLKEDVAGALKDSGGTEALKFRLPPGFKWRTPGPGNITTLWGDSNLASNIRFSIDNDNRDLHIWNSVESTSATFLKLNLGIDVDESVAKTGDVKVTVSGATTADPSELVVATYGEYSVKVSANSKTDIIAGKVAQDIGKLEIDEGIPGSLIPGRTITLTLPENVRWSQLPNIDTDLSQNYGNLGISSQLVGSDGRMLKITFSGTTNGQTEPAKLVLKNMQVTPAADFSGDLNIEVGGSQGVTGTVVLATVKSPVTASASDTPQVIIGKPNQPVGDITITENIADAIQSTVKGYSISSDNSVISATYGGQANLIIQAPPGVTFSGTPKVEVVSGDLQIDASAVSTDKTDALEGMIIIPVKSSSTTPSTIKISGINVTVDRTVPEGDLTFKVKGPAVDETITPATLFSGHTTVAKAVVATVVTPAPNEQKATVVFKVGDTKYTVNGVENTMDVAPYVQDGRTFVPVRYAALALGVSPDNILFNDGKVTLIKGNNVVQLTLGSNIMLINGVAIPMDVNASVINGRTMLPLRWIGQALGATVSWDDTAQTVTITL
ncbi:hypothetical protein MTJW_23960 [Moorella thermoacetica]|nr:hypothetical protein MTJW_23960 [Moorella thermoacetica]